MTRSADPRARRPRHLLLLLLTLVAIGAALIGALPVNADSPSPSIPTTPAATPAPSGATSSPSPAASPCPIPAVTPRPSDAPTPAPGETPPPHNLCPAVASGDPVSLLAFLFNPIFQTLFLVLAALYSLFGDIGIAIILLTLLIKTILIPLFRAQIVSQRRMQMVQPEIRAIGVKYKGNRTKINEEQMKLYRERGVNPASGCLPSFLQLFLLLPIYSVINQGLAAPDISSALQFLGQPVLHIVCQAPGTLQPCIDPTIHWLGNLDAHVPEVLFRIPNPIFTDPRFGLSGLALVAAVLQLIQSRMMTPRTSDPQTASQQRIFMILPLFSLFYGWFLPAGLFIYWIVFTAYSIVQQYLIVGWGSLFPLFGWTPGFARDHQPRFPVTNAPKPPPAKRDDNGTGGEDKSGRTAEDAAAGTFRQGRQRGRTSRRGRRR
jgi:YidC/Oxa1 family membrane protein insertase